MFLKVCNRVIEYSFYALFLLTPLVFTSKTSELFELNKMWLVWGLTIIITASWLVKMVLQKRILLCRTPLDIPIGLFLASQVISTIFSLDSHVSFWGYYSRFNGGLLSIISYILLYYAFLSNFDSQKLLSVVRRLLAISLISGLIVALWGLPSRFGYDPTCLIFRGTLDVSCWTADFLPKVRIFSTLGQPDWLAAYLAILIPIAIVFTIKNSKSKASNPKQIQNPNSQNLKRFGNLGNWNLFGAWNLKFVIFTGLMVLFYVDLLYTLSRSGFLAVWISLIFFAVLFYWMERKKTSLQFIIYRSSFIIGIFLLITFVIGTPIAQLQGFTWKGITSQFQKILTPKNQTQSIGSGGQASQSPALQNEGGTESANIRMNVWAGAISAWKANPIFGTGVETFAFAYYKYKPAGQNLTSEWNFLYNKAHNEFLNYLATTGILGLGAYLGIIGYFFTTVILRLKAEGSKILRSTQNDILIVALLASYLSILITNFFGFSVVITNVYLFMIPAFVFILSGILSKNESGIKGNESGYSVASPYQWTAIFFILTTSFFSLFSLFRFWQADKAYALGVGLDSMREYQQAYPNLLKAVELRGSEPVFKDELSYNEAAVATQLVSQRPQDSDASDQTISIASSLAQKAIDTSNEVVSQYPNNAVFWKTRTRLFFTLSQVDSRYLPRALDAIEKAALLAPSDANILYNLGVLYGQNDNLPKGTEVLEKVVMLKPDYRDAHYALGVLYHTQALDESGKVVIDPALPGTVQNPALQEKALAQMQYILEHISSEDSPAIQSIKDWTK